MVWTEAQYWSVGEGGNTTHHREEHTKE